MEENIAERVVTTVHKSRDAVFLARTKAPVRLNFAKIAYNVVLFIPGIRLDRLKYRQT